jgi:molybdenum ABC transporter molybdate-binding protein
VLLLAPALLGAGALVFGCGRTPAPPPSPPPPRTPEVSPTEPTEDFTLHAPCVIGSPIQRLLVAYQKARPEARVRVAPPVKPLAMLGPIQAEKTLPGVAVTLGEVEMQSFTKSGVVVASQARPLARNTYRLALIVPAEDEATKTVSDVVKLAHVAIEDPALSTLGARAQQAFTKLGLWPKLAPKVLSQLLEGKAEGAVVFEDCLLEGGSAPSTIRVVGTLPEDSYTPIVYQIAPVASPAPTQKVREFLDFLASPEGRRALKQAGLTPP